MTVDAMLSFDLGKHFFPISTRSPIAQRLFDQGLNWCYAFNQDEGFACFLEGLKYDPACPMLQWGAAYAAGPFYNMAWCDFSEVEAVRCTALCRSHLDSALALADSANDLELALIEALDQRIQKPHPVSQTEFDSWDDAYANAMRSVYAGFPDNQDVMALFVEAMMNRTPWQLWDVRTGEPTRGADTLEAITVCERAIALTESSGATPHPAILHLHIHLLEMSQEPERALRSAQLLGDLCPDAGHIHHMPGHIYVLSGDYQRSVEISERAIAVDRQYLAYKGPYNYYTTSRCHDLHLMMYASMMTGQFEKAFAAAEEMCDNLSEDVISVESRPFIANTMEGYYSMKMHVLVRFGKWQEIINAPMPQPAELYCVSTAMHHYAKCVAHAALKNFEYAQSHKSLFYRSLEDIAPERRFFNNPALQTLGVGEMMLLGEMEYHKGNHEVAFDHLREAAKRSDALHYSEPWPWMHPPRHALGALLIEQGQYAEAEAVYRADLGLSNAVVRCAQHRGNVWALHGLVECLVHRGATDEAKKFRHDLDQALQDSDTKITSSCCCRTT